MSLFGTRADIFVDVALLFFIIAPVTMGKAIKLARQGEIETHRITQLAVLLFGIFAVLLLEGSIRFGSAADAYRASQFYGTYPMTVLFAIHLLFALPTFICWCYLVYVSWNRFGEVLPGSFSATHRRLGTFTFLGLLLTCVTGIALYIISFGF